MNTNPQPSFPFPRPSCLGVKLLVGALSACASVAMADDPSCDERVELSCNQVLQFPDRVISEILVDNDGDGRTDTRGTAFLVGRHCALTSGHCIFDRDSLSFAASASIRPAVCMQAPGRQILQLPTRNSFRFETTTKYASRNTTWPYKFDIGAMHFTCPYEQITTFMPLVFNFDPNFARIGGYPGFTPGDPHAQIPDPSRVGAPWRGFGETDYEAGRVVKYQAKSSKGHSGSPVMSFAFDGSGLKVDAFAINSTGWVNSVECDRSGGPRFTDKNRELIRSWMNFRPSDEDRDAAGCPKEDSGSSNSWWDVIDLYATHPEWTLNGDELGLIDPPSAEPMGPSPYQYMQVIRDGFYEFAVFHLDAHDAQSPRFIQMLDAPGMMRQEQWQPGMPWNPDEMGFLSASEATILFSASMARDQFEVEPEWGAPVELDEVASIEMPLLPADLDTSDDPQADEIDRAYVAQECLADLDGDGEVSGSDLARLLGEWGSESSSADFNGDGIVGPEDLAQLLGSYGDCN
ncbi:MAG: hypothetical protein CBC35_09780 [Planctomycetes bacterium TMED75]|nr:hypothetical protein [Planctomycetaceae bacterium]OUU91317.1 MAG: hypothetical protein CBC35_09780 [Planctomycetes bacterium TMED75]